MSVHALSKIRSLAAISLCALTGCAHTYGLSVAPAPAYSKAAQDFLTYHGFVPTTSGPKGEVVMERQRGDSVVLVRIFRGGGSPGSSSFSLGTSGGAYIGGASGGVAQNAIGYSGTAGMSSSAGGSSGLVTLELTAFSVDAHGVRHKVRATDAALDEFNTLIDLVERRQLAAR